MATRTAALSLVLFTAACGNVSPLGSASLELQWRVAPSGCDESGVEVVELRANGPHSVVERFACSRGSVIVPDLTPGAYRIELLGFDANGTATFRGDAVEIDLVTDEVAHPPEFRLLAAPASVDVLWTFANTRVCGANDARWISVSAFDEFDYEVAMENFSCDLGGGTLPALRAGSYQIEATALSPTAEPVARGSASTKIGRGQAVELQITLDRL